MRIGPLALLCLASVCASACGRIGYAHTPDAGLDASAPDAALDAFTQDDAFAEDAFTLADAGVDAPSDAGVDGGPDAFALVDECLVGNGGCSADATCTDLPVGRLCQCLPRFAGDGVVCTALPPAIPSVEAFVKASNSGFSDYFGRSIALSADGNTLAVGANYEDGSSALINGPDNDDTSVAGAVYVYRRVAATWMFEAYVKADNPGASDEFRVALTLSADGNTLAVGARDEDGSASGVGAPPDDAGTDCGAVYVYTRSGSTWSFETSIKASNTGNDDEFGASLALSGDGQVLAVGARLEDSQATLIDGTPNEDATDSGAVYVYRRAPVAAGWRIDAFIKAGETSPFDEFGNAVALNEDGSVLAVGSHLEDSNTTGVGAGYNDLATGSGAVWVYHHTAAWALDVFIKAPNTGAEDEFGVAVALSAAGDVLAIGAQHEDGGGDGVNPSFDESAPESGAVYVYRRMPAWTLEAFIKAPSSDPNDLFGNAIALSDDGRTLAIGATQEDGSSTGVGGAVNEDAFDSGAAYLYRTLGAGWGFDVYIKASNTERGDVFGTALALSSDGLVLAVTAINEDSNSLFVNGPSNEDGNNCGAAYLYR